MPGIYNANLYVLFLNALLLHNTSLALLIMYEKKEAKHKKQISHIPTMQRIYTF